MVAGKGSGLHVGSPGAGATSTDRADAPHPSGVHVALAVGHGRVGLRHAPRGHLPHCKRSMQGCSERPRACAPCPARILLYAGGTLAPRAPPAPSRRAHRALAWAQVRLEGLLVRRTARHCGVTPTQAEHVRTGTRGGALRTWSRDPPSHAPHARRARGRRARAFRWGLGGGTQRTARLDPSLWLPRPSGVLAWLSCVRGASPPGTRGAERRESHFGGRHRTSRYRIRCPRGVHGSWGARRGTRRPDIGSRPH